MGRTAATYKLKDGLSVYVHKTVVQKMQQYPFSINIDECTSSNNHKVFSILVSFFDAEEGMCKVEHYESISLIVANSLTLFDTICELFLKDNIPFDNLVSDLIFFFDFEKYLATMYYIPSKVLFAIVFY